MGDFQGLCLFTRGYVCDYNTMQSIYHGGYWVRLGYWYVLGIALGFNGVYTVTKKYEV